MNFVTAAPFVIALLGCALVALVVGLLLSVREAESRTIRMLTGMVYTVVWAGTSTQKSMLAAEREACHALYARARTNADSLIVDVAKPNRYTTCYEAVR